MKEFDTKELESLSYVPRGCTDCETPGYCGKIEQPNQNLMVIEEIEGLLSQANEKMYELPIHPIRSKAIEEIDVLLQVTIKTELRKAFE